MISLILVKIGLSILHALDFFAQRCLWYSLASEETALVLIRLLEQHGMEWEVMTLIG